MIPKIIHYCWFGRGQMSSEIEMCIESWRKYCPDYTIKRWDEDNSPMENPWVCEAYKHQKYAFVADYMRFYALYHEGGVYMDTDMLLVKPIDELLKEKAFLGRECAEYASMGIIGTEKCNDFAKIVLDKYESTKFDLVNPPVIPHFVTPYLKQYGMTEEDKTQFLTNGWVVYQSDYFYPIRRREDLALYEDVRTAATPNTCGIHLWNMSWADELLMIRRGERKNGLIRVWQRFKRTPFLPFGYWVKVLKALLSNTIMGNVYRKIN